MSLATNAIRAAILKPSILALSTGYSILLILFTTIDAYGRFNISLSIVESAAFFANVGFLSIRTQSLIKESHDDENLLKLFHLANNLIVSVVSFLFITSIPSVPGSFQAILFLSCILYLASYLFYPYLLSSQSHIKYIFFSEFFEALFRCLFTLGLSLFQNPLTLTNLVLIYLLSKLILFLFSTFFYITSLPSQSLSGLSYFSPFTFSVPANNQTTYKSFMSNLHALLSIQASKLLQYFESKSFLVLILSRFLPVTSIAVFNFCLSIILLIKNLINAPLSSLLMPYFTKYSSPSNSNTTKLQLTFNLCTSYFILAVIFLTPLLLVIFTNLFPYLSSLNPQWSNLDANTLWVCALLLIPLIFSNYSALLIGCQQYRQNLQFSLLSILLLFCALILCPTNAILIFVSIVAARLFYQYLTKLHVSSIVHLHYPLKFLTKTLLFISPLIVLPLFMRINTNPLIYPVLVSYLLVCLKYYIIPYFTLLRKILISLQHSNSEPIFIE